MNYLKPATADSFIRSQAQGIHQMWIENLKDLKHVTHPESRQMHIDALRDLHRRAQALSDQYADHLDSISSSQIAHILGRPLESHFSIAKNIQNLVGTSSNAVSR